VDTLVQSPSSSWPRMHSDIQNPFQNAPGPFIYALPNLACFCLSMSSDSIADCSLAFHSIPDQHHHHTRHSCCYHQLPLPESLAESLPTTEEGADANMTLRKPRKYFYKNGLDDKGAAITLSCSLVKGGAEIRGEQWQRQQQQQQPEQQPRTPTPSSRTPSSATEWESSEEQESSEKQENERGGEGKEKVTKDARARVRGRRREHKQRSASDLGGRAMGPRTLTRLAPDPWMYQYRYRYPALYPAQYPYHGMVPYVSPAWYWQPPPAPVPGFVGFA